MKLQICVLAAVATFAMPFLVDATSVKGAEIPQKINESIAVRLVSEALKGDHSIVEWLEDSEGMSDPFFVFVGLNKPPRNGFFGYFAVNPWTGEVWALWGCHKLTSRAVRKSQMLIQRRFSNAELSEYSRFSNMKPDCIVED